MSAIPHEASQATGALVSAKRVAAAAAVGGQLDIARLRRSNIFLAIVCLSLLGGCTYSEINPKAALEDIRNNNGYHDLQDIEPGASKIVLRATGSGDPAHFSASNSPQLCEGFKSLGEVAHTGSGIVYPWVANMGKLGRRSNPYLVHDAKPGESIQLQGHGSWSESVGSSYRRGRCGPVTVRFTPAAGHGYTVDFVWGKRSACTLVVMDASRPEAPVPVPFDQLVCGAPSPVSQTKGNP